MTSTKATSNINMEKYRLRRFVERLVDMGEVEIHDEPVPLTGLGTIIERTEKAVLFKSVGPEKAEMVAKTAASRKRLIAAFETTEEKIYDEYFKRLANPKPVVEIPSGDAPVHSSSDHRQGRRSHQAAVLPAPRLRRQLLSKLGHRLHDRSGDRAQERRLPPAEPAQPLRDRHQRHRAVRPQAHLHRLRGARREAADHIHCRHASARFRRRDHAPARRRAVAGRHHPRRTGGRWSRASPTTSWCRPTPR